METIETLRVSALLDGTHEPGTWSLGDLAAALEAADAPREATDALCEMLDALGVTLHHVGIEPLDVLESLSESIRHRGPAELDELDAAERGQTVGEALDYMTAHADWSAATVVTADTPPLEGERARAPFGRSLIAFT